MAVDYFLKLDGIPGESQDSKHKDEIEVVSWSIGATQTGDMSSGGGGGAGKVAIHDFHFVMKHNKSSPKLFLACANGDHIKSAILVARKAGKEQREYLTWTFSDVLVSGFHTALHGHPTPVDQVSLNFGKAEFEYKTQKPDGTTGGSVKTGWDLKQNKAA